MRYFSMFSGIGGFELGIQNAYRSEVGRIKTDSQGNQRPRLFTTEGQDISSEDGRLSERTTDQSDKRPLCIGYSEIDKYAIKVYERHFNDHTNYGDATTINAKELPDFDLLVGGFPCQSFSVAGKRGGFNDTRGTLFFDVARILKHKRPRHFVLENVKGLLSHDSGKTIQTIAGVLSDIGYRIEWQVLNSKDFGVPQNRERIFIVGHSRTECTRKVFPLGNGYYKDIVRHNNTEVEARGVNNPSRGYEIRRDTIASTLKAGESGHKNIIQLNQPKHSNDRVYGTDGLAPTLNTTMQGGLRQPFVAPVLTPDRLVKRQNGRRFKTNGEPAFTLNTQDRHGIYDGVKIRRLTPIECMRLQGFPDDWCSTMSDTQAYKQAGNAVTVNTVQAVFENMKDCLL